MKNKLPTAIDKDVGRRIRARREELELSQEALAEEVGITFQQLQKYENGTNRVAAGRLHEFAIALKTTISYFFQGSSRARGLRGVAEEGAGFEAGPDPDVAELIRAYRAIGDLAARKSVVAMAKKLAGGSKRRPAKKAKRSGR
jgi:transcriptional regulator with XRE-family HTH domain